MQVIQETLAGITVLLVTIAIIALVAWMIWRRERRSKLNYALQHILGDFLRRAGRRKAL